MCFFITCMSSLQKHLLRYFAHFWLGCLYWVAWGVYIFWRFIPVSHFANIFSYFVSCLLFCVFLCCAKALIRSHLFLFVFVFITLWGKSKKILLWFTSECSASKSFIVSSLIFSSLIHLSLFLCMVLENVLISKGLNLLAQSTKCSIIHPAFLFKLIYSTLTLDFLKQSIHLMSQYLSWSLFNILPGKLLLILEE